MSNNATMGKLLWRLQRSINFEPGSRSFNGIHFAGTPAVIKRIENSILIGIPLIGSVIATEHIFRYGLSLIDLSAFLIFYLFVGLGTALGLHRYFSHRSFDTTPVIAFLLGAFGSMAFQGSVLRWVVDHRRHHSHTDEFGDVHSPYVDPWGEEKGGLRGLLYAHVGWMFDCTTTDMRVYGAGLEKDRLVMFLSRTHWIWPVLSLALPYCFGYVFGGIEAAWSAFLIGGCLRTTVLHNVVWSVNSIGHRFGREEFKQGNGSKNNFLIAVLTFGDGWHNNHHCFPRSAFHGFSASEIDVNGWLITQLERFGLVWNVVRIPENRIEAARTAAGNSFKHV